jgi:hypothetical protein
MTIYHVKEEYWDMDRYFLVNSVRERNSLALQLLRERYELGAYSTASELKEDLNNRINDLNNENPFLTLTDEELNTLPESIKLEAQKAQESRIMMEEKLRHDMAPKLWVAERLEKLLSMKPNEAVEAKIRTQHGVEYLVWRLFLRANTDEEYSLEMFEPESITMV